MLRGAIQPLQPDPGNTGEGKRLYNVTRLINLDDYHRPLTQRDGKRPFYIEAQAQKRILTFRRAT